ncbi:hypothetical protein ACF05L_19075 [Streptomyces bobili]|uniref:cupin domain-containing protein n=1 Tax=Streptomyces bobili TaxID=67280 RepID=UPI0036FAE6CD
MSQVLDTAFIPPQDREEVLRHAVWESVVAVDIDHRPPAEDISVRIGLGAVGPLRICSARATAVTVRRPERLARKDEEPAVFLGVQMSGTSLVVQNGRECLLRPGDLAVYESASPYTLLFDEGVDHHFIRFPRTALALSEPLIRDITAVRLGPDNPVARLAFPYFSQLAVSDELHQGVHADAVVEHSVELLRAAMAAQHGDSDLARGPLGATLGLRITRYMRAHLADPGLSATRIAAAHGGAVTCRDGRGVSAELHGWTFGCVAVSAGALLAVFYYIFLTVIEAHAGRTPQSGGRWAGALQGAVPAAAVELGITMVVLLWARAMSTDPASGSARAVAVAVAAGLVRGSCSWGESAAPRIRPLGRGR